MPIHALLSFCARHLSFHNHVSDARFRKLLTVSLVSTLFVIFPSAPIAQAAPQASDGTCVQQVGSEVGVSVTKIGNDCGRAVTVERAVEKRRRATDDMGDSTNVVDVEVSQNGQINARYPEFPETLSQRSEVAAGID